MEAWFLEDYLKPLHVPQKMWLNSNSRGNINHMEFPPDDENSIELGAIIDEELPDNEGRMVQANFIQLKEKLESMTRLVHSNQFIERNQQDKVPISQPTQQP